MCPHCNTPTFFWEGEQTPGSLPGDEIAHLPGDVALLHREARQAMSAGANTVAILGLRKLLMHVAVSCGAPENQSFVSYVSYLEEHHFVPPRASKWVDQIRKRGNEANHEIRTMERAEADRLLSFTQMLLRLVYEYPAIGESESDAK